tara:strand:- start:180 stop:407 length:228 start_codon:yes stop_codon:yes gene_type:complete
MLHNERENTTFEELSKSQYIRLLDVFFIGPFMIYVSQKAKGINNLEKFTLLGLGIATIYYNGRNYLDNRKRQENV